VYQTESLLKDQGDKVPDDDRAKMEEALKALKDSLAGADVETVKTAHENLINVSQEFTKRLYQNVQAQQSADAPGADAGDAPSDDEVADAEIVEDDEQSA
jgi:molecular chaperone DnaK